MKHTRLLQLSALTSLAATLSMAPSPASAQGVTTSALTGIVSSQDGPAIPSARVVAVHLPTGTLYRATATSSGRYNLPNMRIGGPYRVTATSIGFEPRSEADVFLTLGQASRVDFRLVRRAVELAGVQVTAERDEVLNAGRTGACDEPRVVGHTEPARRRRATTARGRTAR